MRPGSAVCGHLFLSGAAFYEKHGYREVFTLEDYPYTEKRHYYTKAL